MKKLLIVLSLLILSGLASGKEQLKKEKQDMLAFGGILTVRNEDNFTRLGTDTTEDKELLADSWEITNKKEALEKLEWLVNEGHRADADKLLDILKAGKANEYDGLESEEELYEKCNKMLISKFKIDKKVLDKVTIMAWDTDRLVNVARWSYDAKYISEDEAWKYIEKAKKLAQASFDSWEEYYASVVYGRSLAYSGDPEELLDAGKELLQNKNSIWKKVKFE